MPYQTGSATNVDNLMDTLRVFLLTQGWVDTAGGWPISNQQACHVNYTNYTAQTFRDYTNFAGAFQAKSTIRFALGTSKPGSAPANWYSMPGSVVTTNTDVDATVVFDASTITNVSSSILAYHFYTGAPTDPRYCHVAIQWNAQDWGHFSIGNVDQGPFSHGGVGYCTAMTWRSFSDSLGNNNTNDPSDWPGFMQGNNAGDTIGDFGTQVHCVDALPVSYTGNGQILDHDRTMATWSAINAQRPYQLIQGDSALNHALWRSRPVPVTGDAVLYGLPCVITQTSTTISATQRFVYVGDYPNVRVLRMDNISPGGEFSFGGDTWQVFPLGRLTTMEELGVDPGTPTPTTGSIGMAYKKIT